MSFTTIMGRLLANEDTVRPVRIDKGGFLITTSFEKALARNGRFAVAMFDTNAVANNAFVSVLLQTGSKEAGIYINGYSNGEIVGRVWEDTVVSVIGNTLTPENYDRVSPKVLLTTFTDTPTVTSPGTLFIKKRLGSASGSTKYTTNLTQVPIQLKPNSNYLVRLTNVSGVAQDLELTISFYEEA